MNKFLFSERLSARRKECGYNTQYSLAEEYNRRFPSSRKNRKEENTENSSGILGTIKHYENGNYSGSPKLDIVDNLCKILECDVDYLLGNIECKKHDKQFIHDYTGLSEDAIEMLRFWKKDKEEFANSYPTLTTDINIIDLILRYEYEKREHAGLYPASHSVFYFIGCFLSAKKYEKQIQDCLRIYDGSKWHEIQEGDILKQKNMEYLIQDMEAINSITGSGNNPDNLHIWNKENISDRRVVPIDGLYESYSKDNIFRELDKIRKKQLKAISNKKE